MPSHKLGSYVRLPSGSYRASIYIAGRRERKVYETCGAAKRWLDHKSLEKVETDAGARRRRGTAENLTYRELAPDVLDHYRAGTRGVLTERTLDGYRRELGAVMKRWGGQLVRRTSEGELSLWVSEMRRAGLSSSTIRHRLDRLSACHQVAVRMGYITQLPCRIERPRLVQRSEVDPVSESELDELLHEARRLEDPRVAAVILLAADAGLRRSEILRLRGEDVRPGHLRIAVRSEADRPKSGRARDVPILTERLAAALEALEAEPGQALIAGCRSAWMVASLATVAWEPAVGGRAQLHRLRHRFAARSAELGVPLFRLMRWLGHSTPLMTQRYYHAAGPEPRIGPSLEAKRATRGPRRPQEVS